MNLDELKYMPTIELFNRHSIAESAAKLLRKTQQTCPGLATDKMKAELADIEQQVKMLWDELSERMELVPSAIMTEAIDGNISISFL